MSDDDIEIKEKERRILDEIKEALKLLEYNPQDMQCLNKLQQLIRVARAMNINIPNELMSQCNYFIRETNNQNFVLPNQQAFHGVKLANNEDDDQSQDSEKILKEKERAEIKASAQRAYQRIEQNSESFELNSTFRLALGQWSPEEAEQRAAAANEDEEARKKHLKRFIDLNVAEVIGEAIIADTKNQLDVMIENVKATAEWLGIKNKEVVAQEAEVLQVVRENKIFKDCKNVEEVIQLNNLTPANKRNPKLETELSKLEIKNIEAKEAKAEHEAAQKMVKDAKATIAKMETEQQKTTEQINIQKAADTKLNVDISKMPELQPALEKQLRDCGANAEVVKIAKELGESRQQDLVVMQQEMAAHQIDAVAEEKDLQIAAAKGQNLLKEKAQVLSDKLMFGVGKLGKEWIDVKKFSTAIAVCDELNKQAEATPTLLENSNFLKMQKAFNGYKKEYGEILEVNKSEDLPEKSAETPSSLSVQNISSELKDIDKQKNSSSTVHKTTEVQPKEAKNNENKQIPQPTMPNNSNPGNLSEGRGR